MKDSRKIASNTLFVFLSRVADVVSGIAIVALAARYLGLAGYGRYAIIWALVMGLTPLVGFGAERILIRDISVDRSRAATLIGIALTVNGLMAVVACAVVAFVAPLLGLTSSESLVALYIAVASQLLLVVTRTICAVFLAHELMAIDLGVTFMTCLLRLCLVAVVTFTKLGVTGIYMAMTAAHAAGLLAAVLILRSRFAKPVWPSTMAELGYMYRECLPIGFSTMLGQGYRQVNVLLLKVFRDFSEISLYQAPQRILGPLAMFPASFFVAFTPALSRMAAEDGSRASVRAAARKALKYIVILAMPICVYVTIVADSLITILFGSDFIMASASFRILIWTIIPLMGNSLLNVILTAIRKQKVMAAGTGCGLLLNILFGCLLIRRFGHVGASAAFLLSSFGLLGFNTYFLWRYIRLVPFTHRDLWRPTLACCIMAPVIVNVAGRLNPCAVFMCFFVGYIGILGILKTFTADELMLLKSLFQKRK